MALNCLHGEWSTRQLGGIVLQNSFLGCVQIFSGALVRLLENYVGGHSLRRALSPTFPAGEMVFFIPWRGVAEESGAAHYGFSGAMLLDLLGPALHRGPYTTKEPCCALQQIRPANVRHGSMSVRARFGTSALPPLATKPMHCNPRDAGLLPAADERAHVVGKYRRFVEVHFRRQRGHQHRNLSHVFGRHDVIVGCRARTRFRPAAARRK